VFLGLELCEATTMSRDEGGMKKEQWCGFTIVTRRIDPTIYTIPQYIADLIPPFAHYLNTIYNNFSNFFLKNSKFQIKNVKKYFIIFVIVNIYDNKS